METIKNGFAQARRVWERSSKGNRIATVALVLMSVGAIAAVGVWSVQPQYVPLASGLAPHELANIISRIEAENIQYKLNHAGTAISVSKSQWNAARVAAGDAITTDLSEPDFLEGSPLDPREERQVRLLRNKEKSLASTIRRMQGIKSATVHISQQNEMVWARPHEKTRASVLLELDRGSSFGREQAEAIVQLVSHAVEGLLPEDVAITNTRGENILGHSAGIDAVVERQFEYSRRVEAKLAAQAETMLSRIFGLNKAFVRVTADIDFRKVTTTDTTYDPDSKVISKEINETKTYQQTRRAPIGPVGATPSLSGNKSSNGSGTNKEELINAEYKVAQTVETNISAPGAIKRLTVAATVDLSGATDEAGAATVTIEQVEALIKVATGFDEDRTDSITVINAPLPDLEVAEPIAAPTGWDQYRDVVQVVSLGLASVFAVVFGFLTLRRIKPITLPSDDGESEARRARLVADISDQASRDPETVSRIVAAWLNEPLPSAAESAQPEDAASAAA